jgi:putative phosphoribosyl transferase
MEAAMERNSELGYELPVHIGLGMTILDGSLVVPQDPLGVVLIQGGHQRLRHDAFVRDLQRARLATLLIDLLTPDELLIDQETQELRFDMRLLSERLGVATDWLADNPTTRELCIGYLASGTGAGAALLAASRHADIVGAVVAISGRPDMASGTLHEITTPTLLVVGTGDVALLEINQMALAQLGGEKQLAEVSWSSHLLTERGELEQAIRLTREWFVQHLSPRELERAVGG